MISSKRIDHTTVFTLENRAVRVVLMESGARISEFHFAGKDILLGYDTPAETRNGTFYTGATVGRFANRIAGGKFVLNGKEYVLDRNEEDRTHLHGGFQGLDKREWKGEAIGENAVRFTYFSPDMEMGYPGNLQISVIYTLEENGISLSYEATTDRDTVLSLTNHAYFNLDGFDGEDCRRMKLRFDADAYLPVDENLIPTGEIRPVAGTEFDFTALRPINGDYDHCFVFSDKSTDLRKVGEAVSDKSGIRLEIFTDRPAIQLYTCGDFTDPHGKGGLGLHDHQGIALETQGFPDSPHHPNFPSAVLKAGESFRSTTKYLVSKI